MLNMSKEDIKRINELQIEFRRLRLELATTTSNKNSTADDFAQIKEKLRDLIQEYISILKRKPKDNYIDRSVIESMKSYLLTRLKTDISYPRSTPLEQIINDFEQKTADFANVAFLSEYLGQSSDAAYAAPYSTLSPIFSEILSDQRLSTLLTALSNLKYLVLHRENQIDTKNFWQFNLSQAFICRVKQASLSDELAHITLELHHLTRLIEVLNQIFIATQGESESRPKSEIDSDLKRLHENYLFVIKKILKLKLLNETSESDESKADAEQTAEPVIEYNLEILANIQSSLGNKLQPQTNSEQSLPLDELLETIDDLHQIMQLQGQSLTWQLQFKAFASAFRVINYTLAEMPISDSSASDAIKIEAPSRIATNISYIDIITLFSDSFDLKIANKFLIFINHSIAALQNIEGDNLFIIYRSFMILIKTLFGLHFYTKIQALHKINEEQQFLEDKKLIELLSLNPVQDWLTTSLGEPDFAVSRLADLLHNPALYEGDHLYEDDLAKTRRANLLRCLFSNAADNEIDVRPLQTALTFIHLKPKEIIMKSLWGALKNIKIQKTAKDISLLENQNTFVLLKFISSTLTIEDKSPTPDSQDLFCLLGVIEYVFNKKNTATNDKSAVGIAFVQDVKNLFSHIIERFKANYLIPEVLIDEDQRAAAGKLSFQLTIKDMVSYFAFSGLVLRAEDLDNLMTNFKNAGPQKLKTPKKN